MELTELNLTEEQLTGVQSILQSEGDKIRTKYTKEIEGLKAKLPVEKDAETLKYEKEKADFMKEKQQYELSKKLSDKGLSSELSKFINCEGVDDLETYLDEIVNVVGKQAKGFIPNKSNQNTKGNISKEDFQKMNYMERTNLYNTNQELFKILSK